MRLGSDDLDYDEMTGLPLAAMLVRRARREETAYMAKMGVFVEATLEERSRLWLFVFKWVHVDKGETAVPNVRRRLVVFASRGLSRGLGVAETYSAAPPHEAPKMTLSIAMSTPGTRLGMWDVSRAHVHSEVRSEVLVKLPRDLGQEPAERRPSAHDQINKLRRCCCGLRDAPQAFGAHLKGVLAGAGFVKGQHCSCLAHADGRRGAGRIHLFRHGDVIVAVAPEAGLKWLLGILDAKLLIKFRGLFGPDRAAGHIGELSISLIGS